MKNNNKKILSLLKKHNDWRKNCINLIASENVMSDFCEKVYVSDLMHRYAEGLPFKRYYQGLKYIDQIENLTEDVFKKHFKANFVDLRPISGTLANMAVFSALTKKGDKILTLGIDGGAHVSHEEPGAAGILGLKVFHIEFDNKNFYPVRNSNGKISSRFSKQISNGASIDLKKTKEKIFKIKPKFIVLGGSVILFPQPIKELKKICRKTKTKIIYDAAHIFGLITAGFFQNPLKEGVDIITSSTHKTFPGPQGGIILGNIEKDLQKKIQAKVFPGVLSNHHLHRLPALYFTLMEMKKFGNQYVAQIIKNAQALAEHLDKFGFDVLEKENGFTKSHQVLLNVEKFGGGNLIAKKLEDSNIILNKNIIPEDKIDPRNPKGLRIGTQEMTRFGMKEKEMKIIAEFMKEIIIDGKDVKEVGKRVIQFRKKFQKMKYCLT